MAPSELIFYRRPFSRASRAAVERALTASSWRIEGKTLIEAESLRSQSSLERSGRHLLAEYLSDCRNEHFHCEKPFCPKCARRFRKWLFTELVPIAVSNTALTMATVLLKAAHDICELRLEDVRVQLRNRLARMRWGCSVIGGFEIVYRARSKKWVLHVNLLFVGASRTQVAKFCGMWKSNLIERPVMQSDLKDRAKQLSYLLKFATYHRPEKQCGWRKSRALPLNDKQHGQLVEWMGQYRFQDFLFLYMARRQGSRIVLRAT